VKSKTAVSTNADSRVSAVPTNFFETFMSYASLNARDSMPDDGQGL
jgi:hypothetical protein